jgi:hypothetical protein
MEDTDMQTQTQSRPLALGLTVLSILGRLVPHAPNVTPVGGSCLFAGSRIAGPLAYLLPLAVMLATDPLVGGYSSATPVIYAAFLINVWIGRRMLKSATPIRVGAAAFLCSLQFFLLTNLATWVSSVVGHSGMYSADLAGLVKCYSMALPFWGRTLGGDLLFSGALFGMYELLSRRTANKAIRATA